MINKTIAPISEYGTRTATWGNVVKAWDYQFEEIFCLIENSTQIYKSGKLKGKIKDKNYQKSFLSIWFGSNSPAKELKESILKGK